MTRQARRAAPPSTTPPGPPRGSPPPPRGPSRCRADPPPPVPPEEQLALAAETFRMLAEPTRVVGDRCPAVRRRISAAQSVAPGPLMIRRRRRGGQSAGRSLADPGDGELVALTEA